MRKGRDGKRKEKRKEKKKEKRKEKNGVFSGHYVIASSLLPERLRPNDDRWNAARSCQIFSFLACLEVAEKFVVVGWCCMHSHFHVQPNFSAEVVL